MKHITKFKSNEAIHCQTEEQAKAICKIMDENIDIPENGRKLSYLDFYSSYKDQAVIYPKKRQYGSLRRAEEDNYKIHKAADVIAYHTPLPEKWAVKPENGEQAKKVAKYFNLMLNPVDEYEGIMDDFYHSIFNGDCHRWFLLSGYTLIPYAQFKAEYDRVFKNQKEGKNDLCKEQPETIKGTFTITIEPETVTKVFEPEKEPDYTQYIGKKMRGFKFESDHKIETYNRNMDKHIGKIGAIEMVTHRNSYLVQFENDFWYYPCHLAIHHIIEEPITYTAQEVDCIIHEVYRLAREYGMSESDICKIFKKHELLKH